MSFPDTLVLGATGRIGQLLQHHWPLAGLPGHLLWQGRRRAGLLTSVPQLILDPLADPVGLARGARGRQVLCLAGAVPGRGDLADNWHLARAVLTAAEPGARVILCSSAAVYGNQAGDLTERAPLYPANAYGEAKVEMEQRAAALAADRGLQLCILRIGNIAGLDAILGGWKPGFQLDQFDDGHTPARSYIGVATLAQVLADLLALEQLPQVINIAQSGVVQMGALLTAADLHWQGRPAPESAISKVALDCSLLQDLVSLPLADLGQMVQEWRCLEPHMREGQRD